jgi:hypothetical protein
MRQSDPGELSTRGTWNRQSMGKRLVVSRVYVQAIGDNVATRVPTECEPNSRPVELSGIRLDQADAALKLSVRPAQLEPMTCA